MSTAEPESFTPAQLEEEQKRYHTFINLALWLSVLTGIEIVIIFFPFAPWLIITGLVVLSLIKFAGVILWFMHLIYDRLLLTLLFLFGLVLATAIGAALLLLFDARMADAEAYARAWGVVDGAMVSSWFYVLGSLLP